MIAASEPQEFVPGGRQHVLRHPGPWEVHSGPEQCRPDDDFLRDCLERVSIAEDEGSERWLIRVVRSTATDARCDSPESDDESSSCSGSAERNRSHSKFLHGQRYPNEGDLRQSRPAVGPLRQPPGGAEEELYVRGNVVVWSRGATYEPGDGGRSVVASYTSSYPVRDAAWCTFYAERPDFPGGSRGVTLTPPDEPFGEPMPCVCIVDSQNLRAYTRDSEDFVATLPSTVSRVWPTRFGVFLEMEQNEQAIDVHSAIFSLTHPLDEARPVMMLRVGASHIIEDSNLNIVFTSEEPSICMVYDSQCCQHSVYRVRRVRPNETGQASASSSINAGSMKIKSQLSSTEINRNLGQTGLLSPFSVTSPSIISNISHSKNPSPAVGLSTSRFHTSAISSVSSGSPWLQRLSRLHSSIRNLDAVSSIPDKMQFDTSNVCKIMDPELCMEHIWTENHLNQENMLNSAATTVFLSDDVTGQSYLCYMVPARTQLSIVKVDHSNPASIIFGMLTSIGAKAAVPVPRLHMIAILEHSGNIVLYSGLSVVGKLHMAGVLAQHVPSPYIARKNLKLFNSPFPRRSSLLPNSGNADLRIDDHLLSPVLPSAAMSMKSSKVLQLPSVSEAFSGDLSKVHLCGLRDAVEDRLTLQYSDGTYYRVTLPSMVSSALVESCLTALRHTIQRDATITLLTKWYSARNSPGSVDLTIEKEWSLFTGLLLELIGFEVAHPSEPLPDAAMTPSCAAKRQKQCTGSEGDWRVLLASRQHATLTSHIPGVLGLRRAAAARPFPAPSDSCVNTSSVLFPYVRVIHTTLHLLYEDLKLDGLRGAELPLLGAFLSRLSSDLDLKLYVMHYWRDFPAACPVYKGKALVSSGDLKNVIQWSGVKDEPESVLEFLFDLFRDEEVRPYTFVENVNNRTRNVIQLCGEYLCSGNQRSNHDDDPFIRHVHPPGRKARCSAAPRTRIPGANAETAAQRTVLRMVEFGVTSRDLQTYPLGIGFLLHDALWRCREAPPSDWPSEAYHLLQRPDLASQAQIIEVKQTVTLKNKNSSSNHSTEHNTIITQRQQSSPVNKTRHSLFGQVSEAMPSPALGQPQPEGAEQEDGMDDADGPLLRLRFPEDLRVVEAHRLLQSSKPVPIALVQRPDVSDHDFIEEQERHLYAVCTRTMALPIGRGMFTLRTATPVITEPLPVPPLCLTGKAPPRGTTVEMTHIDTPPNMNMWPLFHNGVANALRIDPAAKNIDSTWIVFNKPRTSVETQMEHAGFLMALGLNGHLKNLTVVNTFEYLTKVNEITSVGILIGLAAAFRGTCSLPITKMMSVHVEALLPPTSLELDVPQNLQVAGLLGVGLVYTGSAHRHMTEVFLTEIGRPPGPEMENSVDRESYSLAAGLALGLVTLRQGGHASGLADLNVPDTLQYYMVGGNKRPLLGAQKDKYKVPSFQIREGSGVNLDVTAPGATLALGLMYLGTGNKAIADLMAPPDTQYLLDFIRPDFLMLRILSRALIMWDEIQPEKDWVENQVPNTIRPYCMVKPNVMLDIDYEAMNQAYCNIIAGACFALGLKFAGSGDETAFQTLLEYCHMFISLTSKSIAELAGKPTIETCLNVVLLSVSMVMAGTGNLDIMRIVRYLRRRVGLSSSAVVTYGSHLAIHMALGLLFLGGGRYTLSNSPASVAALICAFYPRFPTHSNDNRYHLQAFRHLYVLAVEPRLIIPKDITTGRMCYANITVVKLDGTTMNLKGPGLIPDLNTLYKVQIKDERYWPVVFEREHNWDQLIKLLSSCCGVDVKQRAGCLSYSEDKLGFKSDLARTLTKSDAIPWDPSAKAVTSFSSDCLVRLFSNNFLVPQSTTREAQLIQSITRTTYDCVIKDKLNVLPLFISMIKIINDLKTSPSPISLWHLKMVFAFVLRAKPTSIIASAECVLSLHQQALTIIENWEPQLRSCLRAYILGTDVSGDDAVTQKLANYTVFYGVPYGFGFRHEDLLETMVRLKERKCSSETVDKVLRILGYIR